MLNLHIDIVEIPTWLTFNTIGLTIMEIGSQVEGLTVFLRDFFHVCFLES